MQDLEGRMALVTGGATARTLAPAGAKVVISDVGDGTATAEADWAAAAAFMTGSKVVVGGGMTASWPATGERCSLARS